MPTRSAQIDAFWQAFRRHTGLDHDHYVVGSFGDNPKMATELADLVIAGIKRATASLARDYGEGRESIPRPGDFVMMLDGKGRPRFIWRTTEVTIKPLSQVAIRAAGRVDSGGVYAPAALQRLVTRLSTGLSDRGRASPPHRHGVVRRLSFGVCNFDLYGCLHRGESDIGGVYARLYGQRYFHGV